MEILRHFLSLPLSDTLHDRIEYASKEGKQVRKSLISHAKYMRQTALDERIGRMNAIV